MAVVVFMIGACSNNVVINGDTIAIKDIGQTVKMLRFEFVQPSNDEYDEWTVEVACDPDLGSALILDMATGSFPLTPKANVKGNRIKILSSNGSGTNFGFQIPKGEEPVSYQIKIKKYVLTYHYDTKTWSCNEDDKEFKPAEKMKIF